uniref:hypothetical protein n=1 Tax=Gelidibacter sp. TaxID=2018083 RepID=UPI00404AED74
MSKRFKKIGIIAALVAVTGIVLFIVADNIVKNKVENLLQNELPANLQLTYSELKISTLNGRITLVKPQIIQKGEITHKENFKATLESLQIDDISYWDVLFNDKIYIQHIELNTPTIVYFKNDTIDKNEYKKQNVKELKQSFHIEKLSILNGDITVFDAANDSLLLKSSGMMLVMDDVMTDAKTMEKKLPFTYSNYELKMQEVFLKSGDYENLMVDDLHINKQKSVLKAVKLQTKYSKAQLSRRITKERDHFDISIDSMVLDNQHFGYKQDTLFYFKTSKLSLYQPKLNVYRDKLVADDPSIKLLYSRMLRDLPIELTINDIGLENGTINYSEKVNVDQPAGEILFTQLNANLKNVSNTYASADKTQIRIQSNFMEKTPLKVEWDFDVNDASDTFTFTADLGKMSAERMNLFTQPNLKVQLEGELLQTYFTMQGNPNQSRIDLQLKYDNFEVKVLDKKGQKINKFLSSIANLFIKKDSESSEDDFREAYVEVERDKTKSVFNFLWLNVKAGLLDAMTGGSKKKD